MARAFEPRDPSIIGNEYVVVGTLPRELWRARDKPDVRRVDFLDHTHLFKDLLQFELVGGGWGPDDAISE